MCVYYTNSISSAHLSQFPSVSRWDLRSCSIVCSPARGDEAELMVNSSGGSSASFIYDDGVQA